MTSKPYLSLWSKQILKARLVSSPVNQKQHWKRCQYSNQSQILIASSSSATCHRLQTRKWNNNSWKLSTNMQTNISSRQEHPALKPVSTVKETTRHQAIKSHCETSWTDNWREAFDNRLVGVTKSQVQCLCPAYLENDKPVGCSRTYRTWKVPAQRHTKNWRWCTRKYYWAKRATLVKYDFKFMWWVNLIILKYLINLTYIQWLTNFNLLFKSIKVYWKLLSPLSAFISSLLCLSMLP